MDGRRYDVIFSGELVAGADPAEVRRRLATLFRSDASAIDRLFAASGPITIKKGVDEAVAFRYRDAVREAGAICEIRAATPPGRSAGDPGGLDSATILPAGTLLPQPPPIEPPRFNLTGLTLAEPGAYLSVPNPAPEPPSLDLSRITLAPLGADILDPR